MKEILYYELVTVVLYLKPRSQSLKNQVDPEGRCHFKPFRRPPPPPYFIIHKVNFFKNRTFPYSLFLLLRSPRLLNPLDRLQQMRHELGRVLRGGEVAQAGHALHHGALDLVGRLLAHVGRGAPVVLAREEVDGALLDVDAGHAVARVEAAEVEVQVAVEDAVRLARVQVPDQLLVDGRRAGRHHAVDPVWVPERLVHGRGLVGEFAVHGQAG